jgi:hypothetical protein
VGLCATIGCILVYGDQFATLAPSALEWREDVRSFARELPKRHKNAFHFISREKFETEVAALDHNLDGHGFRPRVRRSAGRDRFNRRWPYPLTHSAIHDNPHVIALISSWMRNARRARSQNSGTLRHNPRRSTDQPALSRLLGPTTTHSVHSPLWMHFESSAV